MELLRLVTIGSVDDGKSTLIGRLLYDSKAIFQDTLDDLEAWSVRHGEQGINLAMLTDGLRAEREQGITIDVAYRYVTTPRRKFVIADCPGHAQYTRNMVTGASVSDLALVLVDARRGMLEQARRHMFIVSLLGIRHLGICVNKMDLVDYDERVFESITEEFSEFAVRLGIPDLRFFPISALVGDNIVEHSEHMPWYRGGTLLDYLETVHVAAERNLIDARFPVQFVIRPSGGPMQDYRAYAGTVEGGVLRPNDEVVVLPSGRSTRIAGIDTLDGPIAEAFPPMAVSLRLADDLDVSRGDMICRPLNRPHVTRELEAMVCWMTEESDLRAGARLALKHTTRATRAVVNDVRYRMNVETLHRETDVRELRLNEIGRVALRTADPLMVDEYRRNRGTGSFILIDETTNQTVGTGLVLDAPS